MTENKQQNENDTTESIADSLRAVLGLVRAESVGVSAEAMAHSMALIMHNAGSAQYGAQQLQVAVVSSTCAKILGS